MTHEVVVVVVVVGWSVSVLLPLEVLDVRSTRWSARPCCIGRLVQAQPYTCFLQS